MNTFCSLIVHILRNPHQRKAFRHQFLTAMMRHGLFYFVFLLPFIFGGSAFAHHSSTFKKPSPNKQVHQQTADIVGDLLDVSGAHILSAIRNPNQKAKFGEPTAFLEDFLLSVGEDVQLAMLHRGYHGVQLGWDNVRPSMFVTQETSMVEGNRGIVYLVKMDADPSLMVAVRGASAKTLAPLVHPQDESAYNVYIVKLENHYIIRGTVIGLDAIGTPSNFVWVSGATVKRDGKVLYLPVLLRTL